MHYNNNLIIKLLSFDMHIVTCLCIHLITQLSHHQVDLPIHQTTIIDNYIIIVITVIEMIQKYYQKESVNALDQANLVSYELTRVL